MKASDFAWTRNEKSGEAVERRFGLRDDARTSMLRTRRQRRRPSRKGKEASCPRLTSLALLTGRPADWHCPNDGLPPYRYSAPTDCGTLFSLVDAGRRRPLHPVHFPHSAFFTICIESVQLCRPCWLGKQLNRAHCPRNRCFMNSCILFPVNSLVAAPVRMKKCSMFPSLT